MGIKNSIDITQNQCCQVTFCFSWEGAFRDKLSSKMHQISQKAAKQFFKKKIKSQLLSAQKCTLGRIQKNNLFEIIFTISPSVYVFWTALVPPPPSNHCNRPYEVRSKRDILLIGSRMSTYQDRPVFVFCNEPTLFPRHLCPYDLKGKCPHFRMGRLTL